MLTGEQEREREGQCNRFLLRSVEPEHHSSAQMSLPKVVAAFPAPYPPSSMDPPVLEPSIARRSPTLATKSKVSEGKIVMIDPRIRVEHTLPVAQSSRLGLYPLHQACLKCSVPLPVAAGASLLPRFPDEKRSSQPPYLRMSLSV